MGRGRGRIKVARAEQTSRTQQHSITAPEQTAAEPLPRLGYATIIHATGHQVGVGVHGACRMVHAR
jgi:hypothetical protein